MNKTLAALLLTGAFVAAKAQTPQNIKSTGNTLSSTEYIGTNNNEDLVVKTNGSNNTIFKKNGTVKMISLQGSGNRVVYSDANGILNAYPLGQPGQILTADGTWIDPPANYWQINTNGNKLYTTINKVGINTSSPNYTLDVNGDGRFTGNLTLNGELFIVDKITTPKKLKTAAIEPDSIKMDATRAIYGETTIKGDVKAKFSMEVTGPATFYSNLSVSGNQYVSGSQNIYGSQSVTGAITAGQGLKFASGKGIYEAAPNSGVPVIVYGKEGQPGQTILPQLPCLNPSLPYAQHVFPGMTQIYSADASGNYTSQGSILNMQSWQTGSSIDVQGGQPAGGLLVNYFCGKDVFICTGDNLASTNAHGGIVAMGRNVEINGPVRDLSQALNVYGKSTLGGHTVIGYRYGNENDMVNINGFSEDAIINVNASDYTPGGGPVRNSGIVLSNAGGYTKLVMDPDGIGRFVWSGYSAMSMKYENIFLGAPTTNLNSGLIDTKLTISTNSTNGTNIPLRVINPAITHNQGILFEVLADGTTHIGNDGPAATTGHQNAMLTVGGGNGKIACKELYVIKPANWADFVFDKNYKLLPLSEVEKYYTDNKHLPGVPSEAEVDKNGLNSGEMDATLLKKIEELTLYIVELKKEVEELKKAKN